MRFPSRLAKRLREAAAILALLALAAAAPAISPTPTRNAYLQADEFVFLRDEVTRVDITIDPADFAQMLDSPFSNDQKRVDVRWRNSLIDEVIPDVGMRPRGGTFTRPATRKSWRLDINEFVPGRRFHGLKAIPLNGEHNDPTFLRRSYCHEIHRQMGLAYQRTHFVALYINGEFWSIQIHTEQVDDEYLRNWFGNRDGNNYKCSAAGVPADLAAIPGDDYGALGNGGVYEEQNNFPDTDYSDLVDFIRFINDQPPAVVYAGLDQKLHVDDFLRYIASNVALGSWDDYWFQSNNYFLYQNTRTNRFEWIPFDYDNTLGMDYFGTNWSTRSFVNWGNGGYGRDPAPLVAAIFAHSEWRRQFRRYLDEATARVADPANLALLDDWHALLLPYFDGTLESGGTVGTQPSGGAWQHNQFFFNGIQQPATYGGGSYHTMGIAPFAAARRASALSQLSAFNTPALPRVFINELLARNTNVNTTIDGLHEDWIELYNDEDFDIDLSGWHLTDDAQNPYKWTIPAGTTIPAKGFLLVWADNANGTGVLHADYALSSSGEPVALFTSEALGRVLVDYVYYPPLETNISYGRYPDGSNTFIQMCSPTPEGPNDPDPAPCAPPEPRDPPRVFINEFMASNSEAFADPFGNFSDWIELYNDEDYEVDLSGMYMTDDLDEPLMHRIPDGVSIPAKGFLVFWADNSPELGPLHLDFALSINGEQIGLFDKDEFANSAIDTYTFGPQQTDVSEGRIPDGTGPFTTMPVPTPGASNIPPEPRDPPRVFINEFMASNSEAFADPFGNFSDWIELYNDEDFEVDLSGMWMTDDLEFPLMHRIPDGVAIPAKGFLVFWADNSPELGPLHLDFALSINGEQIGLFDTLDFGNEPIDTHTFGPQQTDVSEGRIPDGTGPFQTMPVPTPGSTNDPAAVESWELLAY